LIEEALASAIDEAQAIRAIEGENGDVNFFHYFAEKSGCFEGTEALDAEGLAEGVYFAEDFAENIVATRAASADGEITFAQSGEQIRESAHRKSYALLGAEGETQPSDHDYYCERPLRFRREVAEPQQQQGDKRAHAARCQGQQEDAPLVWKRLQRLYFCRRR
jgi:hypothetical protein